MKFFFFDDLSYLSVIDNSKGDALVFNPSQRDSSEWGKSLESYNSIVDLSLVVSDFQREIEDLIFLFFEACQENDYGFRYGFTSKVLLSIGFYPSLRDFFELIFLARMYSGKTIYVYSSDSLLRDFAFSIGDERIRKRYIRPKLLPVVKRTVRSVLRSFLPVKGRAETVCFSLSHNTRGDQHDSYFADFFKDSKPRVKRVYLSSGNRIKLPSTEYSTPLEAYASIYDILSCAFSSIRDQFYKGDFVFQGINLSFLYNTLKHSEHLSGSYFTSLLIERTSKRVFDTSNHPSNESYSSTQVVWIRLRLGNKRHLTK